MCAARCSAGFRPVTVARVFCPRMSVACERTAGGTTFGPVSLSDRSPHAQTRIGVGGMGEVWKAEQVSTRREVALKLLDVRTVSSEDMFGRFEREVELAARLEHPHITRVYDSGLHTGGYYYAMEFVDGVPLDEYVQEHGLTPDGDILGTPAFMAPKKPDATSTSTASPWPTWPGKTAIRCAPTKYSTSVRATCATGNGAT